MPVYPGASVQQKRDHHRRVIRRPAMTIGSVIGVKRAQVQLLDRAQDAPHEVILSDPIQQRRRHQELLVAAAGNEVPRHPGIQLIAPDGTLFPTASHRCRSGRTSDRAPPDASTSSRAVISIAGVAAPASPIGAGARGTCCPPGSCNEASTFTECCARNAAPDARAGTGDRRHSMAPSLRAARYLTGPSHDQCGRVRSSGTNSGRS
jgi:hypothetical protein